VSYGDIIYGEEILKPRIDAEHKVSVVISKKWRELWSKRMENPMEDAETLKLDADGFITELEKNRILTTRLKGSTWAFSNSRNLSSPGYANTRMAWTAPPRTTDAIS
jgi:hypothetical protein